MAEVPGTPLLGRGKKGIKDLPEKAQLVIGSLQPYLTHRDNPNDSPLAQLNEYANIDRHRQLSVIYSDSRSIEKARVGRRLKDGTFVSFERDDGVVTDVGLMVGALVHGGDLMRFKLTREVPDLDVEYETGPLSIDFGKQYVSLGPAPEALGRMHQYISIMVLPNLAHFFDNV